nr:MAG TPA: hypothetical protein [Bacteriophage sp.]
MSKNQYGMQKPVQNVLQQCINGFERMEKGGIGVADRCVKQACEMALKYINELEARSKDLAEVVRCKDCYYYDRQEDYCNMFYFDPPSDEFYCRDGERKDSENE